MPHLILQTKFPASQSLAEISFFGGIDMMTKEKLQEVTERALHHFKGDGVTPSAGCWRQSPFAANVLQFVIELPTTWECRRILQNVLRVVWLDAFESTGWSVTSGWNCDHPWNLPVAPSDVSPDFKVEGNGFHGDCANFLLYKSTEASAESPPAAPVSAILSRMCEHGSSHSSDTNDGPERDSARCSGLPLPEVVNELLKDSSVLRWDHHLKCYEVMDGFRFEERFNQLRRVRQRHKNGTAERPFSRMHNFYVLERGEKWAKTGSLFRPKNPRLHPTPDVTVHMDPAQHHDNMLRVSTSQDHKMEEDDHGDFNGMAVLSGACSLALSLPLSSPSSASSASTPAVPILPPLPACPPLSVSNLLQSSDCIPLDPASAFQRQVPDLIQP